MIIEDVTDTAKTPTSNAKPDETTQIKFHPAIPDS